MPVGLRLKKKKWICMAYIPSCTQISISILQKQLPSALHTTSYQHFTALTLLPSQPSMGTCKLLDSMLLTQSHPHPMRQKEPKPFLRRVRANKKGRWVGRVAEKMVLPRGGVRHCTGARWGSREGWRRPCWGTEVQASSTLREYSQ